MIVAELQGTGSTATREDASNASSCYGSEPLVFWGRLYGLTMNSVGSWRPGHTHTPLLVSKSNPSHEARGGETEGQG